MGSGAVKSSDGYSIATDFRVNVNVPFTSDTRTENPGKVSLSAKPEFSLSVKNTTPGRSILFGNHSFGTSPGDSMSGPFVLEGVFPAGDPLCALMLSNIQSGVSEGGLGSLFPRTQLAGGCEVIYAYAMVGGDGSYPRTQLAAGESKTLTSFGAVAPLTGHDDQYAKNVSSLSGPFVLGSVPESTSDSVAKSLRNPKALVIGYLSWLGRPGTSGSSAGEPNCKIVASSDPAYQC